MAIKTFIWAVFLIISIGLPVSILLNKKEGKETAIFISPVIGFCSLIAILKILIGFNLTVNKIAWPITIFSIILLISWIFYQLIFKHKNKSTESIFNLNKENKKDIITFLIGSGLIIAIICLGLSYGIVDAIGMTRVDGTFYSGHARLLLKFPASITLNEVPNLPIIKWIVACKGNYHRIGLAAFQALLLGTIKTTSNVTSEIIGALATYLTYCAFMYTGKKMNLSRTATLLASIFGAMIPGFQMLAFENFFGAIVSVPILILFLSLYWQTVTNPNIGTAILSGLVLSIIPTIYIQSMAFALVGMIILALLQLLMFKINSIKNIGTWLIPIITASILNIQYFKTVILGEGKSIGLPGESPLDSLYPFATSVAGIQRNLFGITNENLILGILSIIFIFCGFFGLLYAFYKDKHTVTIPFLAVFLSCIVFISSDRISTYSFYRSLTMSFPFLAFGFVLFFEYLIKILSDDNINGILSLKWGKRITKTICYFIICILVLNSFNYYLTDSKRYTLTWSQREFHAKDYYSVNSGVFAGDNETLDVYNKALNTISKNKNANILMSTDEMTEWSYTILSFVGEKTYFMQESYAKVFSVDEKYYGDSLENLDSDNTIIIHIPPKTNKINDIKPYSEWDNICVAADKVEKSNNYCYSVFSKKNFIGILTFNLLFDTNVENTPDSFNIIINGKTYPAIYDSNSKSYVAKNISINIKKGYQKFYIEPNCIINNKIIPVLLNSSELTIK